MQDSVEYNKAVQAALNLANIVAPTGKVQQGFVKLLHEMEQDQFQHPESYKNVIQKLVASIYDGLAYGNWPEA